MHLALWIKKFLKVTSVGRLLENVEESNFHSYQDIWSVGSFTEKQNLLICFTDFRFWSSFFEFSFNLDVLQTWKMNMITVWMPQDCMACTCALNITSIALAEPDGGLGQNLASCTWRRCIISWWVAELPVLWPGLPALLSTTFIVLTVQFYFTFNYPLTSCPPRPRTQWNREQTQED